MASKLDELEARRAERQAKTRGEQDEQKAIDLEAIMSIEDELGESLIVLACSSWKPGYPALVAFRRATRDEITRYGDVYRGKGNKEGKPREAAQQLARACRKYPNKDDWDRLLDDLQPGMDTAAGLAITQKAAGVAEEEGKA
jgi:hypothetical protein